MTNMFDNNAVKIAVRERPPQEYDLPNSGIVTYHPTSKNILVIDERPFVFDVVFAPYVTQRELFETLIQPMVEKSLKGFNCTALAYGQTGTGKTFTMGLQAEDFESEDIGVIPRCLKEIFEFSQNQNLESIVDVSASFIEIYNEKVYDMLSDNPLDQINVKGHKFLGGLKKPIFNVAEGFAVLIQGNKNRHVRPTKMNPQSSRSHAVFTLHLSITSAFDTLSSCFHLVDLAGSEGVRRTGHQGAALTEGVHINQGLLSIGKVLQALVSEAKVIPYRDSVLSSVLQDSLNINSYLTLLACISPHKDDLSETLSTLRFAQNAKSLKNTPQINSALSEMKKPRAKTPLKGFTLPLRVRNGPLITPLLGKRTINYGQGTDSSVKKGIIVHSNTFCTPSKMQKVEFKKFNQSDFGLTPTEKQKRTQNLFNKEDSQFPADVQLGDYRSSGLNDSIASSLLSLNVSTSTALDMPSTNSYSPIVQKCMAEFEARLENKMQKMLDTFREMTSSTINHTTVNHTPGVNKTFPNGISTDMIQKELRTIIQEEMLSLTNQAGQLVSPIGSENHQENARLRCQLFAESSPIFKVPHAPAEQFPTECTTILESNSFCTFLQDGNKTVVSKTKRSTRFSLRNAENMKESSHIRRSVRLSLKSKECSTDDARVRRSARLSTSVSTEENKENERRRSIRLSVLPTAFENSVVSNPTKRGRKVPTDNKVIAGYFKNKTSKNNTPTKSIKVTKSKHQKAVLDLLNTGSIRELQILPQIGLKTAYQIVTYRTLNGKFKNFEQVSKAPVWRGKSWERFKEANNIS